MPDTTGGRLFVDHLRTTSLGTPQGSPRPGEPAQAIFRLLLLPVAILYFGVVTFFGNGPDTTLPAFAGIAHAPLKAMLVLVVTSVMLSSWALFAPAVASAWRHRLTYLHDFGGLTALMVIGGPQFQFILLPILWQTIGTGLRYGRQAMAVATVCATVSYALIALSSPLWHDEPLLLGMAIVNLLIPPYISFMMRLQETAAARAVAAERGLSQQREQDLQVQIGASQAEHQGRQQALGAIAEAIRSPAQAARKSLLLLRSEAPRGNLTDLADQALADIDQLGHSLDDLEDIDAFLRGELLLDPIRQDLDGAIGATLSRLRLSASAAGSELHVSLGDSLPRWVSVDPHRLRQTLAMLLSSVIPHHARSKMVLTVHALPTRSPDTPEFVDVRFDLACYPPLVESDHAQDPSVLLGQRALAAMGGRLEWFPAAGVDYRIAIPMRELASFEVEPTVVRAVKSTSTQPLALVVDDHRSMVTLMTMLLRSNGYRVVSTSQPERAEELYQDHQPDIVFADFRMPRITGLELIERLRAISIAKRTRFVLMTAELSADVRTGAATLDAFLLSKPVTPPKLLPLLALT